MKNTILAVIGVWISIYTIVIGMEVYNTQVRKNQLNHVVSRVVQEVLETYYKENNEQAKQVLEEQIRNGLHTDAEMELEIVALDMEKGMISIIVTEQYQQLNGKTRTESIHKTAIMERDTQEREYTKE